MKKDIKIIALDLDGTLLTTKKFVTEHTKQVLHQAIERGIIVMPATGRGLVAIPKEVLDIEGVQYALTANGAAIWDVKKGEKVYTDYIDVETTLDALDYAFTWNTIPDVYLNGRAYSQKNCFAKVEQFVESEEQKEMLLSSRTPVEDIRAYVRQNPEYIEKINVLFHDQEEKRKAYEHWKRENKMEVTFSMGNNLELNKKGASKGQGLLAFGKMLGISREQIMVCGDSSNDIEMMKMAGFSVAMENGRDDVKELADFVTKTNDEDGVAYAIEQFVL